MDFLKQLIKKILKSEAKLILKKYKPKIIAITGSVGKTMTKEAIYLVLSKKFFIRKSEKSFTTELGVPLTIIGCPQGTGSLIQWLENIFTGLMLILQKRPYPDYLLLEIDTDKPGDLKSVSQWLKPDILVMTAIGEVPSHVELFTTLDELIGEKKYILDAVKKNGVIIYDADDPVLSNILVNVEKIKVSCSMSSKGDVVGDYFNISYSKNKTSSVPTGIFFDINYKSQKYPVNILGSLGASLEYASLLAFATGLEFKIDPSEIIQSLNKYKSPVGRMNIINGILETIIIDDSYNSSPLAITSALETLKKIETKGNKIAVIGDMLELGRYSGDEHRKIAKLLDGKVSSVVTVGIRARKVAEELISLGFPESNIISVDYATHASKELQKILIDGDTVLIKGSQAMRMEKIVEVVMRHPQDKEKLLVRQDKEWLNR